MNGNDIAMFTCPDLYPDGRTGYDLSLKHRNKVRHYYKLFRKVGRSTPDEAKRLTSDLARVYQSITAAEKSDGLFPANVELYDREG